MTCNKCNIVLTLDNKTKNHNMCFSCDKLIRAEYRKITYNCVCGTICKRNDLSKHLQSLKHFKSLHKTENKNFKSIFETK